MNKLVYAIVDNSGVSVGMDRFHTHQVIETFPEAKACVFGNDTPSMRRRLDDLVRETSSDHKSVTWFSLPNTKDILKIAKDKALKMA